MKQLAFFHVIAITLSMSCGTNASAAEIKILGSNSVRTLLQEIAPLFERSSGNKVTLGFGTSPQVSKRMQDGEPADLVVVTPEAIDDLIKQGKILAGSRVQIARSLMGVAVRAGAPHPDISTPAALKSALLAAKSVTFSDPATGASSGVHTMRIFERLGITEQMKPKFKLGDGTTSGRLVASGEAEIAIWQISAMKPVVGIEIIGPLPPEFQHTTFLSAGIGAASKQTDAARDFIQFLASPEAAAVVKSKGLEPG